MDQRRAGQALYASRCRSADRTVVDVIERGFRDAARRSLEYVNDAVDAMEAELAAKTERLPGACAERARIAALLGDARDRCDAHGVVRLELEQKTVATLEQDVRVLKMHLGKERKRAADGMRKAQAALAETRAAAENLSAFIFGAGYFADLWEGRESLLPPGVPPVPGS